MDAESTDGWRPHFYPVLRRPRALDAFLALDQAQISESAIVAYANRYGWLGHPDLTEPGPGTPGVGFYAEPHELWRDAIHHLGKLQRLADRLKDSSKPGEFARRQLESSCERVGPVFFVSPDLHYPFSFGGGEWFMVPVDEVGARAPAEEVVRRCIERETELHLQRSLSVQVIDHKALRYVPITLRAALYVHFVQRFLGLAGRSAVCKFRHCHEEFTPRRRNHEYHSKSCMEKELYLRRREAKGGQA